jgi:WhiB family redox-sensing transcriptional regulator
MTTLLASRDWPRYAACRGVDPELFFPLAAPNTDTGKQELELALRYCNGCPVRPECLADALDSGIHWGGTTEAQRQALAGRKPAEEAA